MSVSPSRRVRGLILLGSVVATIVLVGLAAFSILLPWVPIVGAAAVVGSFLFVRAGVRAEQAARRARRARARQRQTVRRSPASHRATEPVGARGSDRSVHGGPAADSGEVGDLADAELLERTEVTAEAEGRPDGWQPVPVPPPTYTLKAKAERPSAAVTVDPVKADAPVSAAEGQSTRADDAVDAPTGPAAVVPADGEQPEPRTAAYGT
ncbi:hypothetical protein GA707_12695 [Nostocoides sp. F2B08]|nr:hypothetical protein GA707_12695 [Tetrasphaera sp. F2B08]